MLEDHKSVLNWRNLPIGDNHRKKVLKYLEDSTIFDCSWQEQAHRLLLLLLNVRGANPVDEWSDLVELFRAATDSPALAITPKPWPVERTDVLLNEWRRYRDLAYDLVEPKLRWTNECRAIINRYPQPVAVRAADGGWSHVGLGELATAGPFQMLHWGRIHALQDVIWIAWSLGHLTEVRYRRCAIPNCSRFAVVAFPKKRGRQPRHCDLHMKPEPEQWCQSVRDGDAQPVGG